MPSKHGGPIDPYSPYSLYDVLDANIPRGESIEYRGMYITATSTDGDFTCIPDGHAGGAGGFNCDQFDRLDELVAYLNDTAMYVYEELTTEERRTEVGPETTSDPEKADEDGWLYEGDIPEV